MFVSSFKYHQFIIIIFLLIYEEDNNKCAVINLRISKNKAN